MLGTVMNIQVSIFLEYCSLFSNSEFGFRSSRNTVDAVEADLQQSGRRCNRQYIRDMPVIDGEHKSVQTQRLLTEIEIGLQRLLYIFRRCPAT
ncbi:hypothetical protein J6590_083054 [Homalodisca vitripennis]|nr:hypothetical protein J6590_083054 [Homalodisca vitripennis]